MTAEQQERYSKFRSSGISETEFADEVMKPLGLQASSETCTVMRAIGKMFIGELVDTGTNRKNILFMSTISRILTLNQIVAITIMQEWGDVGPVRPIHLREAYRRIEAAGKMPTSPATRKFGEMR